MNESTPATAHTTVCRRLTGIAEQAGPIRPFGAGPDGDADVAEAQHQGDAEQGHGGDDQRHHVVGREDQREDGEGQGDGHVHDTACGLLTPDQRNEERRGPSNCDSPMVATVSIKRGELKNLRMMTSSTRPPNEQSTPTARR